MVAATCMLHGARAASIRLDTLVRRDPEATSELPIQMGIPTVRTRKMYVK
jgi:hypothetical protein